MTTKMTDPIGKAFIEFFEKQGIQFVDMKTGKPITPGDEPYKKCPVCDNDINIDATKCRWCQNNIGEK